MPDDHRALILSWAMVGAAEAWFSVQGFVTPEPWRIGFELLCVGIVAVNHTYFVKVPWLRSPLWPAAVAGWVTAVVLAPGNGLTRLVFALGLAVLLGGAIRLLHARVPGWAGVPAALLAVIAGRYGVLSWSGDAQRTVDQPAHVLAGELLPLPQAGTGHPGPPIVLVTVDTLRWDHLVRMRTWDRLAARGRTWDRAMSTSSWTLPAMASMLTGLAPADHGAEAKTNGGYQPIAGDAPKLPVALAEAGYTTGAVFSNAWLLGGLGFRDGFHHYWHINRSRAHRLLFLGFPALPADSGAAVTDRALKVLGRLPDRGAFLWVHYVDPHLPYVHAHDALTANLGEGRLRQGLILDDAGRASVREAYAREVDVLDAELARLVDGLEARGWLETGWVILTSDHGEELFDHGSAEHGHSHHGEVVDVGLVIAGPGLAPGPGASVASVIDVPATVRAIAGLPPAPGTSGLDLRAPLPADRVATAYGNAYVGPARSARAGDLRVIVEPDGRIHAYDLATDPAEQAPLALDDTHPLVQAARAREGPTAQAEADVHTEALKALGYLE